jgi:hypothetical protein
MKKYLMAVVRWFAESLRGFYPFMVCGVGGLVMMAHDDIGGLAAMLIASFCFAWALDLSAQRAAAKATETTASKFAAIMLSGEDTTVTIDINHNAPTSGL